MYDRFHEFFNLQDDANALHMASKNSHIDSPEDTALLIDLLIYPNWRFLKLFDSFQNDANALHTACMNSHIDSPEDTALLVDLLIEAGGAEVEATDIDGHTALHFCCLNGLTEAAKVLV